MRYQYCIVVCLAAVTTVLPGCGSGHIPVEPTSGKLTINGSPAVGAIVGLHPVSGDFDERGTRPAGQVKQDGTFEFSTYGTGDGVPVGEYIVTINWPQNPAGPDPGEDRLQGKYLQPAKSPLRITVKEGGNTLDPIALEGEKVLKGA